MEINLNQIREQFPITKTFTYLSHAAASPISLRARDASQKLVDEQIHSGNRNSTLA